MSNAKGGITSPGQKKIGTVWKMLIKNNIVILKFAWSFD